MKWCEQNFILPDGDIREWEQMPSAHWQTMLRVAHSSTFPSRNLSTVPTLGCEKDKSDYSRQTNRTGVLVGGAPRLSVFKGHLDNALGDMLLLLVSPEGVRQRLHGLCMARPSELLFYSKSNKKKTETNKHHTKPKEVQYSKTAIVLWNQLSYKHLSFCKP